MQKKTNEEVEEKKSFNFRLSPRLHEELKIKATRQKVTLSDMVEKILEDNYRDFTKE